MPESDVLNRPDQEADNSGFSDAEFAEANGIDLEGEGVHPDGDSDFEDGEEQLTASERYERMGQRIKADKLDAQTEAELAEMLDEAAESSPEMAEVLGSYYESGVQSLEEVKTPRARNAIKGVMKRTGDRFNKALLGMQTYKVAATATVGAMGVLHYVGNRNVGEALDFVQENLQTFAFVGEGADSGAEDVTQLTTGEATDGMEQVGLVSADGLDDAAEPDGLDAVEADGGGDDGLDETTEGPSDEPGDGEVAPLDEETEDDQEDDEFTTVAQEDSPAPLDGAEPQPDGLDQDSDETDGAFAAGADPEGVPEPDGLDDTSETEGDLDSPEADEEAPEGFVQIEFEQQELPAKDVIEQLLSGEGGIGAEQLEGASSEEILTLLTTVINVNGENTTLGDVINGPLSEAGFSIETTDAGEVIFGRSLNATDSTVDIPESVVGIFAAAIEQGGLDGAEGIDINLETEATEEFIDNAAFEVEIDDKTNGISRVLDAAARSDVTSAEFTEMFNSLSDHDQYDVLNDVVGTEIDAEGNEVDITLMATIAADLEASGIDTMEDSPDGSTWIMQQGEAGLSQDTLEKIEESVRQRHADLQAEAAEAAAESDAEAGPDAETDGLDSGEEEPAPDEESSEDDGLDSEEAGDPSTDDSAETDGLDSGEEEPGADQEADPTAGGETLEVAENEFHLEQGSTQANVVTFSDAHLDYVLDNNDMGFDGDTVAAIEGASAADLYTVLQQNEGALMDQAAQIAAEAGNVDGTGGFEMYTAEGITYDGSSLEYSEPRFGTVNGGEAALPMDVEPGGFGENFANALAEYLTEVKPVREAIGIEWGDYVIDGVSTADGDQFKSEGILTQFFETQTDLDATQVAEAVKAAGQSPEVLDSLKGFSEAGEAESTSVAIGADAIDDLYGIAEGLQDTDGADGLDTEAAAEGELDAPADEETGLDPAAEAQPDDGLDSPDDDAETQDDGLDQDATEADTNDDEAQPDGLDGDTTTPEAGLDDTGDGLDDATEPAPAAGLDTDAGAETGDGAPAGTDGLDAPATPEQDAGAASPEDGGGLDQDTTEADTGDEEAEPDGLDADTTESAGAEDGLDPEAEPAPEGDGLDAETDEQTGEDIPAEELNVGAYDGSEVQFFLNQQMFGYFGGAGNLDPLEQQVYDAFLSQSASETLNMQISLNAGEATTVRQYLDAAFEGTAVSINDANPESPVISAEGDSTSVDFPSGLIEAMVRAKAEELGVDLDAQVGGLDQAA